MINTVIFDLDGTLVQTEILKANSYARAVTLLSSDFIATRDDVEYPKPDPEIYFLVARELGVSPDECLVIEDSLFGIKAALAANMACIAVTTDFTHKAVDESGLMENRWIVPDPRKLLETVEQFFLEKGRNSGK